MSSNLYFLSSSGAVEANEYSYKDESDLQELIAANPDLLLRDTEKNEVSLMLISRETEIPESSENTTYFLDHLFVDTSGVPVLVEVKKSTNSQIRREVVGQMMDYASRIATLNVETLRADFIKNNSEKLDVDMYDDGFWDTVATNLKAERMRLVFAADAIPASLRTLIEFMGRHMGNIEVYGVEIARYKSGDTVLLMNNFIEWAPRVERRTVEYNSFAWDESTFSEQLFEAGGAEAVETLRRLIRVCDDIGMKYRYGRGAKFGSFIALLRGKTLFRLSVLSSRRVTVEFWIEKILPNLPDGWTDERMRSVLKNMPKIDSKHLREFEHVITIDLPALYDEENMEAFKQALKTIMEAQ